jgi:acyltransferase-like protein
LSSIDGAGPYLRAVWSTFGRVASDSSTGATDGSSAEADPKPSKGRFRPDVEGLRAVVAVLLYHAGLPFARGGYVGVDVFFVISGFLTTGLLLREIENTGTLSIMRFYSRRAKRLLPMTVVVLGTVALLSWLLFSPVRMDRVSFDIIAAGLYVMIWLLAVQAADTSEPDCKRVLSSTSGRWPSRSSSTSSGWPCSWPSRGGAVERGGACGRRWQSSSQ